MNGFITLLFMSTPPSHQQFSHIFYNLSFPPLNLQLVSQKYPAVFIKTYKLKLPLTHILKRYCY